MDRTAIGIVAICLTLGCAPKNNGKANNTTGSNNSGETTGSNNASTNGRNGDTNSGMNGSSGTNNGTNNATNSGGTNNTTGTIPPRPTNNVTGTGEALDLLFVIDNSGSMCQEQIELREEARTMFSELDEAGVDFQIGVTTTDMNPSFPLEPVARPGQLQSTPQPVPGFDRSCHLAHDPTGRLVEGDFEPVRTAIAAAVECMETPDTTYEEVTDADIECALYNEPSGCSIDGADCGGGTPCEPGDLFPPPSSYRAIPKVLRSQDYGATGDIDVDAFADDFACMMLVGTRGYGIEKGLQAAVTAVSPELTGYSVGEPEEDRSAPNYGLVRKQAHFGLVFFTNENDCSHDGSLDEATACGGDVCAFANKVGTPDSPLIEPAELQSQLIANLQETKGRPDLTAADVFVASIHGNYRRYDGEVSTEAECASPDYDGITPTCATQFGVAYSGDRYERFLRTFPDGNFFPAPSPNAPDDPLIEWMCTGDLSPSILAMSQAFATFVVP